MILEKIEAINKPAVSLDAAQLKSRVHLAVIGIILLFCAYLAWPAFNAVHLEGFTAQTESIAMLKSRASEVAHDPYLPLVTQFIFQTRSAVIDILSIVYKIFPAAGDLAFQGLVLISFILLILASIIFAKRWGGTPPIVALLALMLAPGIPESAFFFNDNIVSAAFSTIALALISKKSNKIEWLLAGIFSGMAILSRADAIFVMPMIIGILLYSIKSNRERFISGLIVCITVAMVLIISAIIHEFSLIDVFITAKKFVFFSTDNMRWFWIRILFIGIGTLPFLVIGLWLMYRRLKNEQSYVGILTFVIYPVLLAVFAPKATEIRYIFPILAPMVALHVGNGLKWVYEQYMTGESRRRRYSVALILFAFSVAILPPTQLKMFDGPRATIGRLWTPVLWGQWQDSVKESMKRSRGLVNALNDKKLNILISTHYNDEFYLRLRLIEDGFNPMTASAQYPGCNGFSLFKKGESIVAHIRTDPQYQIAQLSMPYNAALQITSAFSCEQIQAYNKIYITTFGNNIGGMPPAIYSISPLSFKGPLTVQFSDMRVRLTPNNPKLIRDFGILDYREMTSQEISETLSNAKTYLMLYPENDPVSGQIVTIENYANYYQLSPGPTNGILQNIHRKLDISGGEIN
jgi:Dolichyl-phosphate-mannose-protein mannosyltransferase